MKSKEQTKETIRELGMYDRKFPALKIGDTIVVSLRIKEGDKERTQVFEGDVIAMHKNGASSTFTVRRIGANAIAVERIFPFYSPKIVSISFVRHGDVRRAKLYFMRDRIGKASRVKEKVMTKKEKALEAEVQEKAAE